MATSRVHARIFGFEDGSHPAFADLATNFEPIDAFKHGCGRAGRAVTRDLIELARSPRWVRTSSGERWVPLHGRDPAIVRHGHEASADFIRGRAGIQQRPSNLVPGISSVQSIGTHQQRINRRDGRRVEEVAVRSVNGRHVKRPASRMTAGDSITPEFGAGCATFS